MRRLLLSGVIVSLGLSSILIAQAQTTKVSNAQISAMVNALRSPVPKTKNPNNPPSSSWPVDPVNIPVWSKRCTGKSLTPTQFANDPTTARQIVSCVVGKELNRQYRFSKGDELVAVSRTACWWTSGDPADCANGDTAAYVRKVVRSYQRSKPDSTPSSSPDSSTYTSPSPSPSPDSSTYTSPTPTPSPSSTPVPEATPTPLPKPSTRPSASPSPSPSSK
jgi:hypothetical protein